MRVIDNNTKSLNTNVIHFTKAVQSKVCNPIVVTYFIIEELVVQRSIICNMPGLSTRGK